MLVAWNKHANQQADLASQCFECSLPAKQMKNRGTNCAFILVVVRPIVVQSSFHTKLCSSTKFSPLRILRRRIITKHFLAFSFGHEEELKLSLSTTKANYSKKNHRIKNSSLESLFLSTEMTPQFMITLQGTTTGGEF